MVVGAFFSTLNKLLRFSEELEIFVLRKELVQITMITGRPTPRAGLATRLSELSQLTGRPSDPTPRTGPTYGPA